MEDRDTSTFDTLDTEHAHFHKFEASSCATVMSGSLLLYYQVKVDLSSEFGLSHIICKMPLARRQKPVAAYVTPH